MQNKFNRRSFLYRTSQASIIPVLCQWSPTTQPIEITLTLLIRRDWRGGYKCRPLQPAATVIGTQHPILARRPAVKEDALPVAAREKWSECWLVSTPQAPVEVSQTFLKSEIWIQNIGSRPKFLMDGSTYYSKRHISITVGLHAISELNKKEKRK